MKSMRFVLLAPALALCVGCALDESGILPNEGGVPDTGRPDVLLLPDVTKPDAPPPDASDGGPSDAPNEAPDPCLSGPHHFCEGSSVCYPGEACDNCGDGGVTPPLFCSMDDTCHFDCTSCLSLTTECYRCADGGVWGVCDSPTGGCITNPQPACDCSSGLSACPGPTQVCVHAGPSHWCYTCGAAGTDNQTCVDGLRCNAPSGTCN